jgi:hypothetical protein
MNYLLAKLRRRVYTAASDRYLSNEVVQERLARQQFFYRAFKTLAFNGIDGDYAEFGCWGAVTFDLAHIESRRHGHPAHLWAFDSFRGLPEAVDERDVHPKWVNSAMQMSLEDFHQQCRTNGIPRSAYSVVEGYYDRSLAALGDGAPRNIALAYIDCDLYSSTSTVLEFLAPRLKHGMILAFDDYFCWSDREISGERAALEDFVKSQTRWTVSPYQTFSWGGKAFVVEQRRPGSHDSPHDLRDLD